MNDFFSHQDEARKRSRIFFVAFFGAVLLAVGLLYFVATGCIGVVYYMFAHMQNGPWPLPEFIYGRPNAILAWGPFLKVTPVLFAMIFIISLMRSRAIKRGGAAYIAEMLGGVQLEQPRSEQEKQFLNVVEEMSVASGLPRPRLYIMEHEKSINAVTAGLDHEDTIIAVTQGALSHLNREELQGVVAHEFAHIFNGDYSLNLTMAGWLYGLLFFSARGRDLIRLGSEIGGRAAAGPIVVGLILWGGGWAGKLSAQLLEAAFSRQREYLADAFAAQYTRNPQALAGALKKIAGLQSHGVLGSGQALTMKSFFIVSPVKIDGLLRTHPPLSSRIERLDPHWDGRIEKVKPITLSAQAELAAIALKTAHPAAPARSKLSARPGRLEITPEMWQAALAGLSSNEGPSGRTVYKKDEQGAQAAPGPATLDDVSQYRNQLTSESLAAMDDYFKALPPNLRQAASDPAEVPALMLSLFISDQQPLRTKQLAQVGHFLGDQTAARVSSFKASISDQFRLPLLSLAAPALKTVRPEIKRGLMRAATTLMDEDGGTDFFEVAALRLINKYLGFRGGGAQSASGPEALRADVTTVLSFAAAAGCGDSQMLHRAFAAGAACFSGWPPMTPNKSEAADSHKLAEAMDRLVFADEDIRRRLLLAVAAAVSYDQVITETEYELLRALAAALEMPLPFINPANS